MSWLILEKPVWVLDQHLACHYYFTQEAYYARRRRVQRGHERHERVQRVLTQHGHVTVSLRVHGVDVPGTGVLKM